MRIVAFLFVMFSFAVHAQQKIFISNDFNQHFSQTDLRKFIRQDAFNAVKEEGMSIYTFDLQYPKYEGLLLTKGLPRMQKAARWVESTGSFDYQIYRRELSRAIRDVILNDPTFESMYQSDATDKVLLHVSELQVLRSGTIVVTERITINNGNGHQSENYLRRHPGPSEVSNIITHGIVRSVPTIYKDRLGLIMNVPVRIKSVERDGQAEDYHSETEGNSLLIFCGTAAYTLPAGVYTYTIVYETDRQIAYHEKNDEVYWNVNGVTSTLATDSVQCKITFPSGSIVEDQVCFTGGKGSTAQDCRYQKVNDSTIVFTSNVSFGPKQGMTVGAFIQKGIIGGQPSGAQSFILKLRDNWPIPAMFLIALILFLINFFTWLKIGKDPSQGVIIPELAPPDDLSPADCGFIYRQEYRPEHFGAAIVDVAVKNGIKIIPKKEGKFFSTTSYHFEKSHNRSKELKAEVKLRYDWELSDLYGQTASGKYNSSIGALSDKLRYHLSSQFHSDYESKSKSAIGMFNLNSTASSWQYLLLVAIGFAAVVVVANLFTWITGAYVFGIFVLAIVQQVVFSRIMSAYTVMGRKTMDHILGFRMYLITAEEKRFDRMNPPEKTLELFEKYLPYAIALDCQNQWAQKFEDVLKNAFATRQYHPSYYHDNFSNDRTFSLTEMTSFSTGLSSTISESSTAPSESGGSGGSDSGGGGSSGGGGGGGGTGGW